MLGDETRDVSSISFSSSSSTILPFLSFFLLLKRPLSIPGLLSFLFLSSFGRSEGGTLFSNLLPISLSLESIDLNVELESSLRMFGVNVIFRVSTVSSLKNESVLRTIPLRDFPREPSGLNDLAHNLGLRKKERKGRKTLFTWR